MIAFFCRTPYHVFRTIQLKFQIYSGIDADIYVFDSFPNAEKVTDGLKKTDVFSGVFFIKDKENFSFGKMGLVRSIYKKSYLKQMMDGKKYSELFLFNVFAVSNDVAINAVKRANKSCIINMVEDGPMLYDIYLMDGFSQKVLYPLLGLWSPSECVDYWWFSVPERMHPPGNGEKKRIPQVDRNLNGFKETVNVTFSYKENPVIRNAQILFMEECYWNDGLLKGNDDLELYEIIKDHYPELRSCVKMHPRTKVNRFRDKFDVIEADGVPWEVYALNMDMTNKILISMLCSTMTSTKFLFGEETFSLLLYPMFVDKVRDVKSGNIYFTENRIEQVKSQVELYDDQSKFVVAKSLEQVISTINDWLLRINA